MATKHVTSKAEVGDWVEARGVHGQLPRRGEIVELLGHAGHEHYRVRWDERHESILYPADGVIVTPRREQRARRTAHERGASRDATTRGGK